MLVAQTSGQLEASQTLAQFHEGRNVAFVLLIVAVGNVSLGVVESAAPARIGIFLADFYQTFP